LQWSGRTTTNRIVHFAAPSGQLADNQILTGQVLQIMIEKAMPHCLWGNLQAQEDTIKSPGKGDRIHAA
jgi:hypothetical protein